MGDKSVTGDYDEQRLRQFTRAVLNDLEALEKMLAAGMFEDDVLRIGAEQEMFLVDSAMHPAPLVTEVIQEAKDGRLTTEIGRFNLEANLTPRVFEGNALAGMETELHEIIGKVRRAAAKFKGDVVLAGILPTIEASDLTHKNLTPDPRYLEIDRVVSKLHGKDRIIQIQGLDQLQLVLQDTFIEFCNTSFQIHLQAGISGFVEHYNWAQMISAPVLAPAVNSPLLLNHRLWQETRVALFQCATDTRSSTHKERNQTPRVNFGDRWMDDSMIDALHEDAVRFRIILTREIEEDALDVLSKGRIPQLSAWRLHNGTIWRWNRPCYGIMNGRAGLRIEARFLPSGPSVADEMANAAFFLGLLMALPKEFGDVRKLVPFDAAKTNFFNAARYGLGSQFTWVDGRQWRAGRLILEELLPRAREGLRAAKIDDADAERLLGILEERVRAEKTGAKWMIDSIGNMDPRAKLNVRMRTLTGAMKANQVKGKPMHTWKLAEIPARSEWIDNYKTVGQFMATDLFTVRPEDVLDLAASLMHWRHVRHVPVEDDKGELVGMITHRHLLRLFATGKAAGPCDLVVRDVMRKELITATPEMPTLEALNLMREKNIGCLPIVRGTKLVGILTAYDFLTVSTKLFEERLSKVVSAPKAK